MAIERLTVQDIAVFFQEALAALPQLVVDLQDGAMIVDIHCGGGRWLIAMARRFPGTRLLGVEFEPDSVARARAHVEEAGLSDRITIEQGDLGHVGHASEVTLAYFQYALHQLADPVGADPVGVGRGAAGRLAARARLVPAHRPGRAPHAPRGAHRRGPARRADPGHAAGQPQRGARLVHRRRASTAPSLIDLPSGATAIVAQRA